MPTTDHFYNISNNPPPPKKNAWNWPAEPVPDRCTGLSLVEGDKEPGQTHKESETETQSAQIQSRTIEIKCQSGEKRGREGGQRARLPSTSAVTAIKPSGGEERGRLCRKSGVRPAAVSATKLGAPLQRIERELLWWERNLSLLECSVGLLCLTLLDNSLEPSRGWEVWREDKRVKI